MEYYSAIERMKYAILQQYGWVILSEERQKEKDKCHMISFTCGI